MEIKEMKCRLPKSQAEITVFDTTHSEDEWGDVVFELWEVAGKFRRQIPKHMLEAFTTEFDGLLAKYQAEFYGYCARRRKEAKALAEKNEHS